MQTESFLSPNVHHLICQIHKTVNQEDRDLPFSEADGWHEVNNTLLKKTLLTPIDFVEAVKILLPFAKLVHRDLSLKDCFWTLHDDVYMWLSKYEMFPKKMCLFVDEAEKMTGLLRFVSTIERALGDFADIR